MLQDCNHCCNENYRCLRIPIIPFVSPWWTNPHWNRVHFLKLVMSAMGASAYGIELVIEIFNHALQDALQDALASCLTLLYFSPILQMEACTISSLQCSKGGCKRFHGVQPEIWLFQQTPGLFQELCVSSDDPKYHCIFNTPYIALTFCIAWLDSLYSVSTGFCDDCSNIDMLPWLQSIADIEYGQSVYLGSLDMNKGPRLSLWCYVCRDHLYSSEIRLWKYGPLQSKGS